MINEKTRRLSKIPEEIKAKGDPYVRDYLDPLPSNKDDKLRKLLKLEEDQADHILRGIKVHSSIFSLRSKIYSFCF